MISGDSIKVVEFNCRFGDPETQAVLPLFDGDLAEVMYACATGTLRPDMVKWKSGAAVCVVMASGGYPGSYPKGIAITGLEEASSSKMSWSSMQEPRKWTGRLSQMAAGFSE